MIERRFRYEIDQGKSEAKIRLLGKVYRAALDGNMRALELCLINQCGWALRPETFVNVVQNVAGRLDPRDPAKVKAHLVDLQRAVWEEARRFEQNEGREAPPDLPPPS